MLSNKHLGCAHLFGRVREFHSVDVARILQLASGRKPQDHSVCQIGLGNIYRSSKHFAVFVTVVELCGIKLICVYQQFGSTQIEGTIKARHQVWHLMSSKT